VSDTQRNNEMKHDVYEDKKYNNLFSDGVTRAFGENKCVVTQNNAFLASVLPLNCDPEEAGLVKVGTIDSD
jgi:hypothetical protein